MLKKAAKEGFAIPAINTQGGQYEHYSSNVQKRHQEMRSPIILAHYVSTGAYSGNDWFVENAKCVQAKWMFLCQFI